MLSRIIYGARTALAVGILSSALGSGIGAVIGVASAYFGGMIDNVIQRFMDILLAFPIIVLALAVVAVLGKWPVLGLDLNLIIAIAIPMIPKVARVVRSSALTIRELPYIDAARAAGYSHSRIIFRHITPNVVAPFLIMFTAFIAQAILLEASLSFLGLGVTEPTAAWGLMLSGTSQSFYSQAPWMILFPGIAISLAVFAFNLFGDALARLSRPQVQGVSSTACWSDLKQKRKASRRQPPLIIRRVDAIPVALPLTVPVTMSGITIRTADNLLVRIEAADGTVGWGEAASAPTMTGDTLGGLVAAVRDHLAPLLIGQDVWKRADTDARAQARAGRQWRRAYGGGDGAARSRRPRRRGRPLIDLIGKPRRKSVRPMWLLGNKSTEETVAEAGAKAADRHPLLQGQDRRETARRRDRDHAGRTRGAGAENSGLRRRQLRADAGRQRDATRARRGRRNCCLSSSRCPPTTSWD